MYPSVKLGRRLGGGTRAAKPRALLLGASYENRSGAGGGTAGTGWFLLIARPRLARSCVSIHQHIVHIELDGPGSRSSAAILAPLGVIYAGSYIWTAENTLLGSW